MPPEQHLHRNGMACSACAGPIGRAAAEELWFYGHDERAGARIGVALAAADFQTIVEGDYIKASVTSEVVPVLEQVAALLSEEERDAEHVAWIIAGTMPSRALAEGLSLRKLQAELRHGWLVRLLESDRLYMHFQPIVSLNAPQVFAHEALVRADDQGREYSGFEIVMAATQAGLIVPLDARTRRTAITQFAASPLTGKVFINFQPSAIYNPQYCLRTTFAAIEKTALRPEDIVFEVIESDEIADAEHLLRILRTYRDHGLGVALDDFGAGFSNAERLRRLSPDYIKLDKAVTAHVVTDQQARERVTRILALAAAQGCRVIAEGIEERAQRDVLRDLGCEFGQGYLFARPARVPEVAWPD